MAATLEAPDAVKTREPHDTPEPLLAQQVLPAKLEPTRPAREPRLSALAGR
ncbi:hypothetical protein ACLESD_26230 [Pyxidicoccus sp. 3LFB2]